MDYGSQPTRGWPIKWLFTTPSHINTDKTIQAFNAFFYIFISLLLALAGSPPSTCQGTFFTQIKSFTQIPDQLSAIPAVEFRAGLGGLPCRHTPKKKACIDNLLNPWWLFTLTLHNGLDWRSNLQFPRCFHHPAALWGERTLCICCVGNSLISHKDNHIRSRLASAPHTLVHGSRNLASRPEKYCCATGRIPQISLQ